MRLLIQRCAIGIDVPWLEKTTLDQYKCQMDCYKVNAQNHRHPFPIILLFTLAILCSEHQGEHGREVVTELHQECQGSHHQSTKLCQRVVQLPMQQEYTTSSRNLDKTLGIQQPLFFVTVHLFNFQHVFSFLEGEIKYNTKLFLFFIFFT